MLSSARCLLSRQSLFRVPFAPLRNMASQPTIPDFANEINTNPSVYFTAQGARVDAGSILGRKFVQLSSGILSVEGEWVETEPAESDVSSLGEISKAASGVWWLSESDYSLVPCVFRGTSVCEDPTGETLWRDVLKLHPGAYEKANNYPQSAVKTFKNVKEVADFLSMKVEAREGAETLAESLLSNLEGLSFYQVGSERFNPALVFLLGRTKAGNTGGLVTAAVET